MARAKTQKQKERDRKRPTVRTRSVIWPLAIFLAAVFLVKLVVLLQLKDHPLLQPEGGLDSVTYVRLAERVMGGDFALGPGLYFVSPLYIYFLAGTLWIGGSFMFVRVVQIALGTAAVWNVFQTARVWFGTRAAWIAAALMALTGVITFYEIVILQSALDVFLTSAALYTLTGVLLPLNRLRQGYGRSAGALRAKTEGGSYEREGESSTPDIVASGFSRKILLAGVLSGVFFGLQILNRPNVAIAVAGLAISLVAIRRFRPALLLAAGVALALAPVVVRNAVASHQLALVSSQGGLNFYIGNNVAATGQYSAVPGVRANIEGQSEDTRRVAEQASGRALTDSEVSSYFTRLATSWMRDNPLAAARLFAKKLALVFNWRHQWLDFSYPYYAQDTGSILWALFVGSWLLVPLGFAGLACMPGESGRSPEGTKAGERKAFLVWTSFIPWYALSVALFFVAERYRLPLFVPLCVTSGAALDAFMRVVGVGGSRAAPALLKSAAFAVAGALVAFWPFHVDDGRYDERLRLAKVLMNEKDFGRAVVELEEAHRIDPSNSIAEFNLGIAMMNDGRGSEGVQHIRRAVDAGVPIAGARYALANALLAADRDEALRLLRTFVPAPDDPPESCYQVALLALRAGAPVVARRYLDRALTLRPDYPEARELISRIPR